MGIFDLFSDKPAQDAASAQISGLNKGKEEGTNLLAQGLTTAQGSYGDALKPFQTNFNTAQPGVTAYANATGANGAAGTTQAQKDFVASPGYAYQVQQGNENALRNASRVGDVNSGGTMIDLNNVAQGAAKQDWQSYISNLLPFLSQSTSAAQGIGAVDTAKAGTENANFGDRANLAYTADTGVGNANANADLAKYSTSANALNLIQNLFKSGAGGAPSIAGNIGSAVSGLAAFL